MYKMGCVEVLHTAHLVFHTFPAESLFYVVKSKYLCSVIQTTKAYETSKKHLSVALESEDQTAHYPSDAGYHLLVRGSGGDCYRLGTMRYFRRQG